MFHRRSTTPRTTPRYLARDALRDYHPQGRLPLWSLRCICKHSTPKGVRKVYRARPLLGSGPLAVKVIAAPGGARADYEAMMDAHAFAPDLNERPLFIDDLRGVVATPYHSRGTIQRYVATSDHDGMIAGAGRWLRRFHDLGPVHRLRSFSTRRPADWLAKPPFARAPLLRYPDLHDALTRREADLTGAPCQIVTGHNDFKPANIVDSARGYLSIDRSRQGTTLVETEIARFLFVLRRNYTVNRLLADRADARAARDREIFLDAYGYDMGRIDQLDLAYDRAVAHAWLCADSEEIRPEKRAFLGREVARIAQAA